MNFMLRYFRRGATPKTSGCVAIVSSVVTIWSLAIVRSFRFEFCAQGRGLPLACETQRLEASMALHSQ